LTENVFNKDNRINLLDALRGSAIIFIILYHFSFDLQYLFNITVPYFESDGIKIIHFLFLIVLILVSGICTAFSRNSLKRGSVLFFIGEIITIITSIFLPDEAVIFGAVTFFGVIMMLYSIAKPFFVKIPWEVVFAVSMLLYIVFCNFENRYILWFKFNYFIENRYLYPLGLAYNQFKSADYFPLIPYGFVFIAGTALSIPVSERKLPERFYSVKIPFLDFIGRNSLLIYIVHQPVIMGIMLFIKFLLRN
jgi:uncharacterized membrane protein